MKTTNVVLYERIKGNKDMKISISLTEAHQFAISFAAGETLSGDVTQKFGKQLTNIRAEAVRDAVGADNDEQMMERLKEYFHEPTAYSDLIAFLKSRQVLPLEA